MIWTDRIRQVKILLVSAAIVIAAASLAISHFLVADLENEEKNRMAVWAEAMRTLNNADENTDLNLVLKVINENNTIPVVVLDSQGKAQVFRNVTLSGADFNDSLKNAALLGKTFLRKGRHIKIMLNKKNNEYIQVCYDESLIVEKAGSLSIGAVGYCSHLCCRGHLRSSFL